MKRTLLTLAAPAPSPNEPSRLLFLDGLRGFAILMVMLRHYYIETSYISFPRWANVLKIEVGVLLFLVLSGFGLAWAYLGPKQRPFSARDFFLRRCCRILPAYYVALLLAVCLALPMAPHELLQQVVTHITLTHNLFSDTVLGLYAPFWSMALEFQLYLCFPFVLWSFRRWGVGRTLFGLFLFHVAFRTYTLRYGTSYTPYTFTVQWSVLGRLFSFTLAMGASTLVAKWQVSPPSRLVHRLLPVATCLLLIGGVLTWYSLSSVHPLTDLCWSIGFVGVILWCSIHQDWLARLLPYRLLTTLGIMSYSVFLIHAQVLTHLVSPWYASHPSPPSPLFVLPFALAAMVAVSWLFYWGVEKPLSDYFYRLRTQRERSSLLELQ